MEYRLTQKARGSDGLANPTANKILGFMKDENHGVVNPDEIKLELGVDDARSVLDSMVKGGYLSKEEEDSSNDAIMGPDPYAHLG